MQTCCAQDIACLYLSQSKLLNLFELNDKDIDREEFDKRWKAMMFKINQNYDMDLASTRQLQLTYNLLTKRFN